MWIAAKQTGSLHQSPNPPQQSPLILPVPLHCCKHHLQHRLVSSHPVGPLFRPLSGRNPSAIFPSVGLVLAIPVSFPARFANFRRKLHCLMLSELQHWWHCPFAFPVYFPALFVRFLLMFWPSVVIAAAFSHSVVIAGVPSPTGSMRAASSSPALDFHLTK